MNIVEKIQERIKDYPLPSTKLENDNPDLTMGEFSRIYCEGFDDGERTLADDIRKILEED